MSIRNATFCTLMLITTLGLSVETKAADEKGLWSLWQTHTNNPNDHAAVIKACSEFRKKNPNEPFIIVSESLLAWHLLKIGKTTESAGIFAKISPDRTTPLPKAGSNIANAWLTRLDIENAKKALQIIYTKNIAYPVSFDAVKNLPDDSRPPMTDRWGKPWAYRLVGLKSLKSVSLNQKYELTSVMLGKNSDLNTALEKPYGYNLNLKPVKLISAAPGKETIQFMKISAAPAGSDNTKPTGKTDNNVFLSIGTETDGISFVYFGSSIIMLANADYWNIQLKPK